MKAKTINFLALAFSVLACVLAAGPANLAQAGSSGAQFLGGVLTQQVSWATGGTYAVDSPQIRGPADTDLYLTAGDILVPGDGAGVSFSTGAANTAGDGGDMWFVCQPGVGGGNGGSISFSPGAGDGAGIYGYLAFGVNANDRIGFHGTAPVGRTSYAITCTAVLREFNTSTVSLGERARVVATMLKDQGDTAGNGLYDTTETGY